MLLFYPEEYFAVEELEVETALLDKDSESVAANKETSFDIETNEIQLTEEPKTEEEELDVAEEPKNETVNNPIMDALLSNDENYYAYSHMNENLKPLYRKIYEILASRTTEVEIPTKIEEEISIAFRCVIQDHPELFYVDGYVYSIYRYGDDIDSILFGGKYSMDETSMITTQESIDAYVDVFHQGITAEMDTYERVKAAYEFIVLNTTYDLNSPYNQNANSVFVYRKSVCQGYAEAFQYLLYTMNIPCMVVTGTADGEPHAFNLVEIDDAYYYADTTWGEGQEVSNADGMFAQDINYNYLNITTEEISKTHTFDSPVALPICNATAANYYVREGTYFSLLDTTKINDAFNAAYAIGKKEITIKCANADIYQQMLTHMFTNEHIFDYVQKSTSRVTYFSSDLWYTITVYL